MATKQITIDKRADELTLKDVWVRKDYPCQIVMLMWTGSDRATIRVWYQDPYTPPEAHKQDWLLADDVVKVQKEVEDSVDEQAMYGQVL